VQSDFSSKTDRRGFMGRLSGLAAFLGLGSAPAVLSAATGTPSRASASPEFEAWLDGITGKHKQVFDAINVNDGSAAGFARTWMNTTGETYGLQDRDLSGVIVVRHAAMVLAFNDTIWSKYKFGETYKITDPVTKEPAVRNPWAYVKPGELQSDDMALDKLLARGVKIGVCNVALQGRAGRAADAMKLDKDMVRKEWAANVLPGVMIVPSGVLAVHRAQEKGCTYCFAG
jgi:intracellular sulfur oxidation DsrE/DsrF family protein